MRYWRISIITLLILALPIASMATISNFHCMTDAQSVSAQMELSLDDHCDSNNDLNTSNDSPPAECSCDCKDTLGCLNSSAFGFALSNLTRPIITPSHLQLSSELIDQLNSFHTPPLIRPPIIS